MAKSSWRFEFVDVNKSIDIEENDTRWIGFASIRAPKGNTEATYVPPNNKDWIQSMFGFASADYPDLYDVIEFNREYGVYISAPSAVDSKYPNYYGGVYLTRKGLQNFYRLSDKNKPNFEVGIVPGQEAVVGASKNAVFEVEALNQPANAVNGEVAKQATIKISNILASVFKKINYIDFDFWAGTSTFRYKLDKATGLIYPAELTDAVAQTIVCGHFVLEENNTYTIYLGGSDGDHLVDAPTNTYANQTTYGIPFIDLASMEKGKGSIYDYSRYNASADTTFEAWVTSDDGKKYSKLILDAILEGGVADDIGTEQVDISYTKPLKEYFHFVYNNKEDVFAYSVQTSPTADKTVLNFNNVVFDKYVYDLKLPYLVDASSLPAAGTPAYNALGQYGFSVLVVNKLDPANSGVYQFVIDEEDNTKSAWKKVNDSFETKKILAWECLLPLEARSEDEKAVHHSIFFIEETGPVEMTVDATNDDYKLLENTYFNTFHSYATEVDKEGETHVSGDLTGSLDEYGTDENGGDNYWEELLVPGESVCFAEIRVVRKFDDDLDDKGVYTGTRFGEGDEVVAREVHGQRFVDAIVQENIKAGRTGGDVSNIDIAKKYARCLKLGLVEAAKPKYEDAIIFFECSGIDSIKQYFTNIRINHKMATIISPKNITEDIFANINKVRVTNPLRGSAQYVQELQFKDRNLRKKYWASPMGAVAVMLLRIIERAYGAVAPMWENDNEMGGQIGEIFQDRVPIKARWDFEDLDTKTLDDKGLNPIIYDSDDGVMITSQKTTELHAGDWSSLGHSMAFDLCKREIRDNVMKPQIGKKINDYWMDKRQGQVDEILRKRTSGADPAWAFTECNIKKVNNDYTRAQRIFCISVDVRVFPFSEKVKLTFTNLSQITTVSE